MPFTEIDMQLFTSVAMLKPENGSHPISKGTLPFSDKMWFCKEVQDPIHARYEVLSQELYRVINPEQPQTYVGKDARTNQYYILSEEVSEFQFIPYNKQIRLTRGVYSGFGQILVMAIFLHEIDLNLGNLGINYNNTIIKLDGEWSFAALKKPDLFADKPAAITSTLLKNLPRLTDDYFAYNWLDVYYKGGEEQKNSDLFSAELNQSPQFRFEVHQTMFLLLLVSPGYIRKLVEYYIPENSNVVVNFILARQVQLQSAMMHEAFLEFLFSASVNIIGRNFLQQLLNFKINNVSFIQQTEEIEEIKQHFSSIEALKEDLIRFKPQNLSNSSGDNETDEEILSNSNSLASIDNINRFFTPSPASLRSNSTSTLKFNRTSSNLSQYFGNID